MDDAGRTAELAVVLRPAEQHCEVGLPGGRTATVGYGAPFGSRAASLAPGHLVAVTRSSPGLVLWRWYDAVVLGQAADGVRLWEPGHGEVLAAPRDPARRYAVGTRAYASAGLPGADWWVEGAADAVDDAEVAVEQVLAFYAEHDLWDRLTPSA